MKKYWKLIALFSSALIIVSFFYVKSAASTALDFQAAIKDVEGDRSVLDGIEIFGSAYPVDSYHNIVFKLHEDTTVYESELSYLKKLDRVFYLDDNILRYQKEHRNFMRGKTIVPYVFSEDEMYIASTEDHVTYNADTVNQTLEISRLNKKTNETDEATYSFGLKEDDSYLYVADTYYHDNRLSILVQQDYYLENSYKDTYALYVWNFETQSMEVERKPLTFLSDAKNVEINMADVSSSVQNSSRAAFLVRTGESVTEYNDLEGNIQNHIFLFDYKTMNITEVISPEEGLLEELDSALLTDDTLYVYNAADGNRILSADVTKEQPVLTFFRENDMSAPEQEKTESDAEEDMGSMKTIEVHGDNLYLLDEYKGMNADALIEVYDLNSKKKLYTGSIVVNEGSKSPGAFEVYLSEISFKE